MVDWINDFFQGRKNENIWLEEIKGWLELGEVEKAITCLKNNGVESALGLRARYELNEKRLLEFRGDYTENNYLKLKNEHRREKNRIVDGVLYEVRRHEKIIENKRKEIQKERKKKREKIGSIFFLVITFSIPVTLFFMRYFLEDDFCQKEPLNIKVAESEPSVSVVFRYHACQVVHVLTVPTKWYVGELIESIDLHYRIQDGLLRSKKKFSNLVIAYGGVNLENYTTIEEVNFSPFDTIEIRPVYYGPSQIKAKRDKNEYVILFPSKSSYINDYSSLDSLLANINPSLKGVEIIGFTDTIGSINFNNWLAGRRAMRVEDYLIDSGISNEIIKIDIKGEKYPVFDLEGELDNELSRRVEVKCFY